MSEMVDRVAKAMVERRGLAQNAEINWDAFRADAAAAIEAMREPTRDMVQAAYDKLDWGYPDGVNADFYRAWQAMIGAALGDGEVK